MAATPEVNITLAQGVNFNQTFPKTELDGSASNLVDFTGASKIKKHPESKTSQSFTVGINTITSVVSLGMTSGETVKLKPGRHVYDIVLTSPSGVLTRMQSGSVIVTAGITT